jgi:hypothetical protein
MLLYQISSQVHVRERERAQLELVCAYSLQDYVVVTIKSQLFFHI